MGFGAIAALWIALAAPAFAQMQDRHSGFRAGREIDCAPGKSSESAVVEILNAQTVRLADGRFVRLAGVLTPPPASSPLAFQASDQAFALLKALALGRKFAVRYGGQRQDRYGVHLAFLLDEDGKFLQERLIGAGLALSAPRTDSRACADLFARAEDEARRAKRGLWATDYFKILPAWDTRVLRRLTGTFQIIEGRVREATMRGKTVFLNFGSDWRNDFSLRIPAAAGKLFRAAGRDPEKLKGQWVRVRGWLTISNGPLIEVSHPEQIEIIQRRRDGWN